MVFYEFESMKWQIASWQGTSCGFDPPPGEDDILEALLKGILTEKEADSLRNTDWESFNDKFEYKEENSKLLEANWTKDQDKIFDLYMRFMTQLNFSRTVVRFQGRKND